MKKNYNWVFILLISLLVISGCSKGVLEPKMNGSTETPNIASLPSFTPTIIVSPTSTSAPTFTPTLSVPVSNGTPYPTSEVKLISENISGIELLGHYGKAVSSYSVESEDGKRIFLQTSDGIGIYQTSDNQLILHTSDYLNPNFYDSQLAVSQDGGVFAFVTDKVYVKNIRGDTLLEVDNPRDTDVYSGYSFKSFLLSPDGKSLLVPSRGPESAEWTIYDIESGAKLEKKLNPGRVDLVFAPDGQRVFAYDSGTGYFASYLTSNWTYEFSTAFEKNFGGLTVSQNLQYLAITVNGYVRIYNFNKDMVIKREIKLDENSYLSITGFSLDNSSLSIYSGGKDKYINIDTGEITTSSSETYYRFGNLMGNNFNYVTSPPDSSIIPSESGENEMMAQINGILKLIQKESLQDKQKLLKDQNCALEALSEDGSYSFCYDRLLLQLRGFLAYLYDIKNDSKLINWSDAELKGIFFSPNGKYAAIEFSKFPGLDSSNYSLILYDLVSNQYILQKGNLYNHINNRVVLTGPIAYSLDSSMLVYVVEKQDARDKKTLIFQFLSADKGQKIESVSASEDLFVNSTDVTSLAISPDNSILAVGTSDGVVTIFDIDSQQKLHSWQANNYAVNQISFTPDQTLMGTFSPDGFMNIWGLYP